MLSRKGIPNLALERKPEQERGPRFVREMLILPGFPTSCCAYATVDLLRTRGLIRVEIFRLSDIDEGCLGR